MRIFWICISLIVLSFLGLIAYSTALARDNQFLRWEVESTHGLCPDYKNIQPFRLSDGNMAIMLDGHINIIIDPIRLAVLTHYEAVSKHKATMDEAVSQEQLSREMLNVIERGWLEHR